MILSLDQSLSKTAYCCFNEWQQLEEFGVLTPWHKWSEFKKIHWTIEQINILDQKHAFMGITLESLPYGSNSISTRPLAGLFYAIGVYCYHRGIPFHNMIITSVKKYATGRGNALKTEMYKEMPQEVQDRFLAYQLEKVKEKKKENIKERYINMTENENYFKSSTLLLDLSDSYHIGKYFLKEGK